MNFVNRPTLKHMALSKMAIYLCTRDDIITENSRYLYRFYLYLIKYDGLAVAIENLPLPYRLKKEVSSYIKPIKDEMIKWSEYLYEKFGVNKSRWTEVRWTSAGTVDRPKSVDMLVKSPRFSLKTCFKLACNYCLVDEIHDLMSERKLSSGDDLDDDEKSDDLVVFWTRYLNREFSQLRHAIINSNDVENNVSYYYYAFRLALCRWNPTATKYFFAKLSTAEHESSFFYALKMLEHPYRINAYSSVGMGYLRKFGIEILSIFLASMSENERVELFERHPKDLLYGWLEWPAQNLLLDNVNLVFKKLNSRPLFFHTFSVIVAKINYDHENCLYRNLFFDFWNSTPLEFIKDFINLDSISCWLIEFLEKEEVGLCRLLLRDADAEETEKIFFTDKMRNFCAKVFHRWIWGGCVKRFLEEEVFSSWSAETSRRYEEITYNLHMEKLRALRYRLHGQPH